MALGRLLMVPVVGLLMVSQLSAPISAADAIDHERDVKSILKTHCFRCHGPLKAESGQRLDTKALALKGGENGAALVPGNAADSRIVQRVTGHDKTRMPPEEYH